MSFPRFPGLLILILTVALIAVNAPVSRADITIAADARTDYVITLPSEPTAPQQTAAKELQKYLAQATGAELPVRSETQVSKNAPQIVVGASDRMRELAPDADVSSLQPDGIIMKTVGKNLILAGDPPRGTLYAVFTFLEEHVGVRWWTSEATFVPEKPTLTVGSLDVKYAPPFIQRSAFYREPIHNPIFAAHLKLNGHHQNVPAEYGGHRRILGFVHTFNRLLPPDKYYDEHPEWYSLIDGKRVRNEQLCLSNDAMRKELTKKALAQVRQNPDAGMISISQNDRPCGACQCEECKAMREKYGGEYSGDLIWFINKVAEDIEDEFPDTMVETLAYHYTRTPPENIAPRDNVVVRLCSIECSFLQPLGTSEENKSFREDIEGWSDIAPHLFVWNYVTNFHNYILPHPNMRVLAPNIRFFADNSVIALFEQGDSYTTVGDFVRLRAWLLSHLMWDPSQDAEALVREFVNGYYGDAAPYLLDYLELIHDAAEESDVYLRCYMPDTSSWLPPEDVNRATRLFTKALNAVKDNPELHRRVRRAKMPLDNVWLKRYKSLEIASKQNGREFGGPKDPAEAAKEFIRLSEEFNNKYYGEGRPFKDYERRLREKYIRSAGPPPEKCKDLPEDQWVEFQDAFFGMARSRWGRTVDDPRASDGKAARMPATHHEWAVQCHLSDDLTLNNPWHCYVVARCDVKKNAGGDVMTMGIYDLRNSKGITSRSVKMEAAKGPEYKVFDLGTHDIHGGCYVWVAPRKRPDEVEGVYVDRIFLIREEKGQE